MLVLECDPDRLASDGFTIAQDVCASLRVLLPRVRIDHVKARTERQLLADLARCRTELDRYDIVLVVGHSNEERLALGHDTTPPWSIVAKWIEPLSPRQILLVACQGGRRLPAAALFKGISSLKEIYGTPILSTEQQLRVLQLLAPYLLSGKKLKAEKLRAAQFANFVLTGGIIFRQTRADVLSHSRLEAATWSGLEDWLRHAMR